MEEQAWLYGLISESRGRVVKRYPVRSEKVLKDRINSLKALRDQACPRQLSEKGFPPAGSLLYTETCSNVKEGTQSSQQKGHEPLEWSPIPHFYSVL